MKLAAVVHLPGAEVFLAGVVEAAREAGHDVLVLAHRPSGPHDFLERSPAREPLLEALTSYAPDAVLAADYPYGFLREATDAPVVALRHSLASRGNTWAPAQAEADWIVSWSTWDEEEFQRRHVAPRRNFLRAGPVFLGRNLYREQFPCQDGHRVVWAPTWNQSFRCAEAVLEELGILVEEGWFVELRPHLASIWREDSTLDVAAERGITVVADRPLLDHLAVAGVVVTDISGAGLASVAFEGGGPPVVHVDPPDRALAHNAQFDPVGPEWLLRGAMGPCLPSGVGIADACHAMLDCDDYQATRLRARDKLLGPLPPEDPCAVLVDLLERAL